MITGFFDCLEIYIYIIIRGCAQRNLNTICMISYFIKQQCIVFLYILVHSLFLTYKKVYKIFNKKVININYLTDVLLQKCYLKDYEN